MAGKTSPSANCVVKCEFGKKETGYIPREKLLAFLKETFGKTKEFGIEVLPLGPSIESITKRFDWKYSI